MASTPKHETLSLWRDLPDDVNPLDYMQAIPYKASGSKYGACGIRIDGTPEFINAVLGRLKGLLDGENHETRLELARHEVATTSEINGQRKEFVWSDGEVCYIRLHERGNEGKIASAVFDRDLDAATNRYCKRSR